MENGNKEEVVTDKDQDVDLEENEDDDFIESSDDEISTDFEGVPAIYSVMKNQKKDEQLKDQESIPEKIFIVDTFENRERLHVDAERETFEGKSNSHNPNIGTIKIGDEVEFVSGAHECSKAQQMQGPESPMVDNAFSSNNILGPIPHKVKNCKSDWIESSCNIEIFSKFKIFI